MNKAQKIGTATAATAAVIIAVSIYSYLEYFSPVALYMRGGATPFWTVLESDTREVTISQGETKTIPVELHYWKGLKTLLGIKFEEPEAEHGGLYNPPDGLAISFDLDDAYVEVDNGKIIDIFTHRDVRLKEPSEIQQRAEGRDMVLAEVGSITISVSKDVPVGDYYFGLATADADVNSLYSANSQLLAISVLEEDAAIAPSSSK